MAKTAVKNFYGRIMGYLDEQSNGDIIATDFYGKILGYYRKNTDTTTNFYGRVIAKGNMVASLIKLD